VWNLVVRVFVLVTVSVGPGEPGNSVTVAYVRDFPSYVYVSVVVAGHEEDSPAGAAATKTARPARAKTDLMTIVDSDGMVMVDDSCEDRVVIQRDTECSSLIYSAGSKSLQIHDVRNIRSIFEYERKPTCVGIGCISGERSVLGNPCRLLLHA
jgi:hypothetical protein